MGRNPMCCTVPDHVLRRIAERGHEDERRAALQTMATSITMRSARTQAEGRRWVAPRAPEAGIMALDRPVKERIIRDAGTTENRRGPIVRQEDQREPVGDPGVDEAFEYLGDTWDFFFEEFARNSIDKSSVPQPLAALVRLLERRAEEEARSRRGR